MPEVRNMTTPLEEHRNHFSRPDDRLAALTVGTTWACALDLSKTIVDARPDQDSRLLKREGHERVLHVAKTNLGPEPEPIRFEIVAGTLMPLASNETLPAIEKACDFLQVTIAEGPRPATELCQEAALQGISKRTVERAKDLLGVVSEKRANGWMWLR